MPSQGLGTPGTLILAPFTQLQVRDVHILDGSAVQTEI
jgi:hypothetical protein